MIMVIVMMEMIMIMVIVWMDSLKDGDWWLIVRDDEYDHDEGQWRWWWWCGITKMIIVFNFVKLILLLLRMVWIIIIITMMISYRSIYARSWSYWSSIYLSMVRHPFIIKYYDRIIDKPKTRLYIIMEYCSKGWRSYTINLIQTMTIKMIRCCFFLYTSSW